VQAVSVKKEDVKKEKKEKVKKSMTDTFDCF